MRGSDNIAGAVLTFSDRPSELSGALLSSTGENATDYWIVLFAADSKHWRPQSRRIVTARPALDGKYQMRNVPPGEYFLIASSDVEQGQWFDPAFLQRASQGALRITVGDGEKKAQDLTVK